MDSRYLIEALNLNENINGEYTKQELIDEILSTSSNTSYLTDIIFDFTHAVRVPRTIINNIIQIPDSIKNDVLKNTDDNYYRILSDIAFTGENEQSKLPPIQLKMYITLRDNEFDCRYELEDGRHRICLANLLNLLYIPVQIIAPQDFIIKNKINNNTVGEK